MTRSRVIFHSAILILLNLALAGCLPSSEGNLDEQKDPHYLNGRARVTTLDYKGAIEEFEKALETNPRNSSAHLELALLSEEQMKDYAAAIYHYERHLRLRPNSDYAERAKERIKACKMDLVKTEILGPVNQGMQQEMERLTTENMLLKQRVENLEAQLTGRLVPNTQAPAPSHSTASPTLQSTPPQQTIAAQNPSPQPPSQTTNVRSDPPARASRTHTVKAGDKLTSIAKNYGVDLSKLLSVNPGVDPSRLQIGQKINIP